MTDTLKTVGSLCTGTGALDAAVLNAGDELAWMAESDHDASTVLDFARPTTPNVGDLIKYPWSLEDHVDLLTSGDPCQSMSIAGRRRAHADPRFLWPHVVNVIDAVRPDEIFLENVQNVVSMLDGAILRERLNDLTARGYAVRWTVLGACAVGAPHHRHRWFLRARHVGVNSPDLTVREVRRSRCGAPRSGGRILLPSPRSLSDDRGAETNRATRTGTGGTLLDSVALLPSPAARDGDGRGEGLPGFWANRRRDRPTQGIPLGAEVNLLPSPRATDGVNGGPNQRGSKGDLAMGTTVREAHWGKFTQAIELWEEITGMPCPDPTVDAPRGGRRLNPELSEWMMGLPSGFLTGGMLSRNAALKMAGNGVVTRQARAAWEMLTWE